MPRTGRRRGAIGWGWAARARSPPGERKPGWFRTGAWRDTVPDGDERRECRPPPRVECFARQAIVAGLQQADSADGLEVGETEHEQRRSLAPNQGRHRREIRFHDLHKEQGGGVTRLPLVLCLD